MHRPDSDVRAPLLHRVKAAAPRREPGDEHDVLARTHGLACFLGKASAGRVLVQPLGHSEGDTQRHTDDGSLPHDRRVVPDQLG